MSVILKAENISKQYRLGTVGTGTLSHDLNRWWHSIRGKDDPYLKIGGVNDRSLKASGDYVWALKDINFEVKQGEVLGIIGKNGAGKSTLLKILSRVTAPSTGIIKTKGRIASLLEVGTGFHPELTGRENIYLNGAILGMTKSEITSKLDEIIDFSGCEMYIDTPVKRYSSGMTVRLAFAVAAHLEPEILVIDEVLAVGDAEFQKKAIGKMQDLSSGQGRTVLLVSHNMGSIEKLANRCLILSKGELIYQGKTKDSINYYLSSNSSEITSQKWHDKFNAPGDNFAKLKSLSITDSESKTKFKFYSSEDIYINIEYWDLNINFKNTAIIHLLNELDDVIFASNEFNSPDWADIHTGSGVIKATCRIPGFLLAEGNYKVLIAVGTYNPNVIHFKLDEGLTFCVIDELYAKDIVRGNTSMNLKWPGIIRPLLNWEIVKKDD